VLVLTMEGTVLVKQITLPSPPPSPKRRKPVITYPSPSKDPCNTRPYILRTQTKQQKSPVSFSQVGTPSSPTPVSTLSLEAVSFKRHSKLEVPSWQDRLPLYHPLGRLAASLPPFDPTSSGLPNPPGKPNAYAAEQLRPQAADEEGGFTSLTTSGPQNEADGKPESGTQKRRSSGGGTKRKRKDPDDGDSAYPARRARGPARSVTAQVDDVVVEAKATVRELSEEPLERRQTRSRGPIQRADSGLSDAASTDSIVEKRANPSSSNHDQDEGQERAELGVSNNNSTIAPV